MTNAKQNGRVMDHFEQDGVVLYPCVSDDGYDYWNEGCAEDEDGNLWSYDEEFGAWVMD